MQHEDTGVDLGWLRVGSSVQDIRGRRVSAVLEACWDRRGHLQRDLHFRLET